MRTQKEMLPLLLPLALVGGRSARLQKFDAMLAACSLPASSIECIGDRKLRILFGGVNAAVSEERVRRAFEVVYVDLGPVRVAGDIIFSKLQRVASDALDEGCVLSLEDTDPQALHKARQLFDAIDRDASQARASS